MPYCNACGKYIREGLLCPYCTRVSPDDEYDPVPDEEPLPHVGATIGRPHHPQRSSTIAPFASHQPPAIRRGDRRSPALSVALTDRQTFCPSPSPAPVGATIGRPLYR